MDVRGPRTAPPAVLDRGGPSGVAASTVKNSKNNEHCTPNNDSKELWAALWADTPKNFGQTTPKLWADLPQNFGRAPHPNFGQTPCKTLGRIPHPPHPTLPNFEQSLLPKVLPKRACPKLSRQVHVQCSAHASLPKILPKSACPTFCPTWLAQSSAQSACPHCCPKVLAQSYAHSACPNFCPE